MSEKKFSIEAGADGQPAFILCLRKPKMKAKICGFKNEKEVDDYLKNSILEKKHSLRIRHRLEVLEVVDIEENFKDNQLKGSLKRMADWIVFGDK